MEAELLRLWNLVSEITEQLNQNRGLTEKLQSHAGQLHEQAGQVSNDVTLRRFNTDLSKEILTSELERVSVALIMENQSLLHENKQLSILLQDYEKTLHTVMEKFRGHFQAAETHHLTLNRHYETLLAQERADDGSSMHATDGEHLANLTTSITRALRSMQSKDTLPGEDFEEELQDQEHEPSEEAEDSEEDTDDWAEERESEIQRLERENEMLRHTLGISPTQGRELGIEDVSPALSPTWDKRSFSFPAANGGPSAFRDDRSRTNGRAALGLMGGLGEQRRPGLFGRGGFDPDLGAGVSSPERVLSPPNEIRWSKDASMGPMTESI